MKNLYFVIFSFIFYSCIESSVTVSDIQVGSEKLEQVDDTQPIEQEVELQESHKVKTVAGEYVDSYFWRYFWENLHDGNSLSESLQLGYFSNTGINKVFITIHGTEDDFYYDLEIVESDLVYGKNGKLTGEAIKDDFEYRFTENKFIVDGGRGEFLNYTKFDSGIIDSIFYSRYSGNFSMIDSTSVKQIKLLYNGNVEGLKYQRYKVDKDNLGNFYFKVENSDPFCFVETDSTCIVYDAVANGDKIEFYNKRRVYTNEYDSEIQLSDTLDFILIREKG